MATPSDFEIYGPDGRQIGRLSFDDANHGVLSVVATDEAVQLLEHAWREVESRESLPLTTTDEIELEGHLVRSHGNRTVSREDADYRWAVADFLETRFGLEARVAD